MQGSSQSAAARHVGMRLPLQATPLIGREGALREAKAKLLQPEVRLLSLTGPGGTGKTRLALALAKALEGTFERVAFIDLSVLSDPEQVAPSILQSLEERERGREMPVEALKRTLADRSTLLVLDNFEQLLPAAPLLAELLPSCPKLKLLVTSRTPLKLRWEHVFAVPPLSLPNLAELPPLATLKEVAAVALLLKRAEAAGAEIALSEANARTVAQICHRLDGLPLALELAAPRLKLFSPQELLGQLEHRLGLLGAPDLPPRQRTLRAEIGWSYALLKAPERTLFRRLGVFVGGFTLAAVTAVGGEGAEVETLLASLVEQSLVRPLRSSAETRFGLLETIRVFALEKLGEDEAEQAEVEKQHGAYYFGYLQSWGEKLFSAEQKKALERIGLELDNLRAAWGWSVREKAFIDLYKSARVLCTFYDTAGQYRDGTELFAQAAQVLDSRTPHHQAALGRALAAQAWLYKGLGEFMQAAELAERALALLRPLAEGWGVATALSVLGYLRFGAGQYEAAAELWGEALRLAEGYRGITDLGAAELTELTANMGMAEIWLGHYEESERYLQRALSFVHKAQYQNAEIFILYNLGFVKTYQGDALSGRAAHLEGLRIARAGGYRRHMSHLLYSLSLPTYALGDYREARALCEEAAALSAEDGDLLAQSSSLNFLGRACVALGELQEAQRALERSLEVAFEMQAPSFITAVFLGLGELRAKQGQPLQAALWAALTLHHPTLPYFRAQAEKLLEELKPLLRSEELAEVLAHAEQLSLDDVPQLLWEQRAALPEPQTAPPAAAKNLLSDRETQVLGRVAEGLTNKRIAADLNISEKTVARHLENIFNKLGVSSRAAATAYAVREGIVQDRRES